MNGTLLITKTLNQVLRQYPPTYLGLRLLADGTDKSIRDRWIATYAMRKAATKRHQSYWKYSAVKGIDATGKIEYRHFLVGSPTTALAESELITTLSTSDKFRRHPTVYSYWWPYHRNSSHLFAHFISGYKRREKDVATAVSNSPNSTCIILDLKNFYPSVNKRKVRRRFLRRVDKWQPAERDRALFIVDGLLGVPGEPGLPVGPALSHVLANIALENVDKQMSNLYSGRYFRYVDDVVIIVQPQGVKKAIRQFTALVKAEGLDLNTTKTDTVKASEWRGHVESHEKSLETDNFGALIRRIQILLARSPEQSGELKQRFRDAGFSLPLDRLRSVAAYGRFRRYLNVVWSRTSLTQKWLHLSESPESLVTFALSVGESLFQAAEEVAGAEIPTAGMRRRWHIQEIRYRFARMLYLLPFSEYRRIMDMLPPLTECDQIRVVAQCLRDGDATQILSRPGPAASTFAQLWRENVDGEPKITWSSPPKFYERDAAVTLATHGVITVPESWILQHELHSNRVLLQLANNQMPESFTPSTPDYLRELECLKRHRSKSDLDALMRERFNSDEEVSLFGLQLGGNGYMS